jgi:hypothetical protein
LKRFEISGSTATNTMLVWSIPTFFPNPVSFAAADSGGLLLGEGG